MRGADWSAHIAAPGGRASSASASTTRSIVQMERDGLLDDPRYIERLADDHPLRRNENVFAFSLGCASLEIAQFISMVVAPAGIASYSAQNLTTSARRGHLLMTTLSAGAAACTQVAGRAAATRPALLSPDPTGLPKQRASSEGE